MKLSEMNTRELATALCDLAPHMEAIAKDEEISRAFSSYNKENKGMNGLQKLVCFAGMMIPLLLDKQKDHTFAMLAILTGKTAEELQAQNGMATLREARQVLDKDFMEFFKSST